MSNYVVHDAGGVILRSGECPPGDVTEQAINAGDAVIEAVGRDDTDYVSDTGAGTITPRPETGLPEAHTLAPSTDWTISPIPEGMAYAVLNANGGTIASGAIDSAESLTVNFAAAGTYFISLGDAWPWRDGFCTVTVTA